MSGINWKVFLTAAILAVGLYLIIMYRDNPDLRYPEKCRYRTLRYIGWVIFVGGFALGIYFYCTGGIKFKAKMPNDCGTCKLYINRHRGLRPYSVDEYQRLKSHAAACNVCSDMCFDEIELLQRYPPVNQAELKRKKEACADTTKYAILARNNLGHLESKMRGQQAQYWKAAGSETVWSPFPQVPTR